MSLPSSRFAVRFVRHGHHDILVNGKRIDVGKATYVVVDLHEEFPPRPFTWDRGDSARQYCHDMNYAHDPNYRIMVDRWKKKTT